MSDVVELKLKQLSTAHSTIVEKVDDLDEKLFDPDVGLYRRIRDLDGSAVQTGEKLDNLSEDIENLVEICRSNERRASKLEAWSEDHDQRDDVLREQVDRLIAHVAPLQSDLDERERRRKWLGRVLWIIITALLAGGIKMFAFDRPAEQERLKHIEEMLEKPNTGTPARARRVNN